MFSLNIFAVIVSLFGIVIWLLTTPKQLTHEELMVVNSIVSGLIGWLGSEAKDVIMKDRMATPAPPPGGEGK